jgi:hypothetical protein
VFLSLYTDKPVFDHLSPRCMLWQTQQDAPESIWLVDLRPCLRYWTVRARGVELIDFLRVMLLDLGLSSGHYAVLADSPWRSLLVLEVLITQTTHKELYCVDAHSILGERYLRGMSWEQWWRACDKIPWHKEHDHRNFKNACQRMAQAMQKLPLKTPFAASQVLSPESLRRRYGDLFVRVWQWIWSTNTAEKEKQKSLFDVAEDFPWQPVLFEHAACIDRSLDHVYQSFDEVEAFLQEDLARLVKSHENIDKLRVVSLKWKLRFDDHTCRDLPVKFRYPHPLHLENPHFQTALLQASFSFSTQDPVPDELNISVGAGVVGWQLSIDEKISITQTHTSLFDNENDSSFQSFENKLKVPLYHYRLKDDWIPERSYDFLSQSEKAQNMQGSIDEHFDALDSRLETARHRPLFILREPMLFDKENYLKDLGITKQATRSSAVWTHLERVSPAWWKDTHASNKEFSGDYYRYVDSRAHLWMFRSYPDGMWYVRGFFG